LAGVRTNAVGMRRACWRERFLNANPSPFQRHGLGGWGKPPHSKNEGDGLGAATQGAQKNSEQHRFCSV
jgi:hypothetical protein